MFSATRRRLALLNAAVAVSLVVLVGAAILLLVRYTLDRQAHHALADQAEAIERDWAPILTSGAPVIQPTPTPDITVTDEHHPESPDQELLDGGDAIPLIVDSSGALVGNPRGLAIADLPDRRAVAKALSGSTDTRTVRLNSGARVSTYTRPIVVDGEVVGVVQVIRGQALRDAELHAVELALLVGAGIGAAIAVLASLFLARQAMQPIEGAFRRQQAFVADASHELRTPLAVVRANTELIRRMPDAPPAERDKDLAAILSDIDGMNRIVDDLLTLARADADQLVLQRTPADLSEIVRGTIEPMRALAASSGVSLSLATTGTVRCSLDADRIRQVLRIVLGNAIVYAPGGSVNVEVSTHGRHGIVAIHDTGSGIPPEDQERVFERFYRVDRSRSHVTGGAGLGLAIAKAIVEAHGGTISLRSVVGSGTTVTFELPLARDNDGSR